MSPAQSQASVPIQRAMGCLVASIQVDLDERVIQQLADSLLEALHRQSARGIILDLSGVAITTTPLGFENFIKQSQPKTGLLARIMGKLK